MQDNTTKVHLIMETVMYGLNLETCQAGIELKGGQKPLESAAYRTSLPRKHSYVKLLISGPIIRILLQLQLL